MLGPQVVQQALHLVRLIDPREALLHCAHHLEHVTLQLPALLQIVQALAFERKEHVLDVRVSLEQSVEGQQGRQVRFSSVHERNGSLKSLLSTI